MNVIMSLTGPRDDNSQWSSELLIKISARSLIPTLQARSFLASWHERNRQMQCHPTILCTMHENKQSSKNISSQHFLIHILVYPL